MWAPGIYPGGYMSPAGWENDIDRAIDKAGVIIKDSLIETTMSRDILMLKVISASIWASLAFYPVEGYPDAEAGG